MKRFASVLALAFALGAVPARAQNSVRVSWTASPDAGENPSLTYNVYRAGSCPGQFTKLNSAPLSSTSYLDTNAAIGAVYCYQVTAVLNGIESLPSNQAIAAVPPPANRQNVCRHRGALIGWIRCQIAQPKRQGRTSPPR
jgi:Rhamnogalacturonan I lyases beta-sheet domain